MTRFVTALLTVFSVLLCAPVVSAQEEKRTSDKAYDECISRKKDVEAFKLLTKETGVDIPPTLLDPVDRLHSYDDAVQKVKKENPELFEKKLAEVQSDPSFVQKTDCLVQNPADTAVKSAQEAVSGFWKDPVGKLTKAMLEGNAQFMEMVMTFWMDFEVIPSSNLAANVHGVKNIVWGVAGFALIASFLVGGARLAAARRSGLQDGVEELGINVGKWLIFSLAVPVIIPGALIASDELAKAIMSEFGATSVDTFVQMTAFDDQVVGPVVMLILTAIAIAGSVMQLLALVIRVLVLPIAAGLAPLFAAASFTETGRSGLHHLVGYMIAAVAFKPISALLYSVVLWNVTRPGSGDDFTGAVVNALMLALAGLIAPSLVRMITPMVSQAGGMGAGGLIAGTAGATGAGISAIGGAVAGLGGGSKSHHSSSSSSTSGQQVGASTSPNSRTTAGGSGPSGGGSSGSGSSSSPAASSSSHGSRSGGGASRSTAAVATGSKSSGSSQVRHSRFKKTSSRSGAVARGAGRGIHKIGAFTSQAGASARSVENLLEGSLGYPGQIHR